MGLSSLEICSPGLTHGLPLPWISALSRGRSEGAAGPSDQGGVSGEGGGLTRLVLRGARLPWRPGGPPLPLLQGYRGADSTSGLCRVLSSCPGLRSLSFVAQRLASEEWACLTRLSLLTQLSINDWGGGGRAGQWLGPDPEAVQMQIAGFQSLSLALEPTPWAQSQAVNGSPPEEEGGAAGRHASWGTFLSHLVNGPDLAAPESSSIMMAVSATVASEGRPSWLSMAPPLALAGCLPNLRALRVGFAEPKDLLRMLSAASSACNENSAGGLPSSLESLHVSFRDDATGEAARRFLWCGLEDVLCRGGAGSPDGEELEASLIWSRLVACCPRLTDLNVHRTWTLPLTLAALTSIAEGLPRLEALHFCGDIRISSTTNPDPNLDPFPESASLAPGGLVRLHRLEHLQVIISTDGTPRGQHCAISP